MGLNTLHSRRDRAQLKWWYKLATLPEDTIDTLSSYLIRSRILKHIEEGRRKCGVGWRMMVGGH